MKRKFSRLALVALLLPFLAGGAAPRSGLKAGAARAEIVVPLGMPLSGYGSRINEPSTGVHDPTFSRALVLESSAGRAGLICIDGLLITEEIYDDLAGRVADLDLDFLSASATHTHYGIGAYVDNKVAEIAVMGKYDPEAYQILVEAMEKSLREAAADLEPARVGAGVGEAPGVSANRRHKGGPTDPTMRVLGVWSRKGDLIAVIMNHAIHPTAMPSESTLVSGDVAGRAESEMERMHPGSVAMFMNSGLGDQSPGLKSMGATWERVNAIGDRMAERADEILTGIEPQASPGIVFYDRRFDMPKPHMRKSLQCWFGLNQLFPIVGRDMIRKEGGLRAMAVGDALLLFSPPELSYGMQEILENSFPDRKVFVVTHSNDYWGYVVTPDDYDTGGYETCMNFYGRDFGPFLVEQFKEMIAE